MEKTLHKYFGYTAFRPNQKEIITAVLAGRDVFAIMPTGGGKSLCYQMPSLMLPGVTLVISPLIALMKDQVDAARDNGIAAAFLNSTSTPEEKRDMMAKLRQNDLHLLYVSPERFHLSGFQQFIRSFHVALIAIDEAHCISEWGHDFRPDYLELASIVDRFPNTPVAAFTATATVQVQHDIVTRLRLRHPLSVRASFDRPNLSYQVIPKTDYKQQVVDFLKGRPGQSGILYRTSRKDVDFLAKYLKGQGIQAVPYHAGLPDAKRQKHQDAFNRDKAQVVVATIAFGMGIDKSNVRFVVHVDLPKSLEGYYQETGRAGRDGEPAECLFLYRRGDAFKLQFMIRKMERAEQKRANEQLHRVMQYAESSQCRRKILLDYFDESYPDEACHNCDVCGVAESTAEWTVPLAPTRVAASPLKASVKEKHPRGFQEPLFQSLRALRREIAESMGMPPYIVFSDKSLKEMASRLPKTAKQFLSITGVGEHKLSKYGEDFLKVIRDYSAV